MIGLGSDKNVTPHLKHIYSDFSTAPYKIFLNVLTHHTGKVVCDIGGRPCVLLLMEGQSNTFIAQARPTHFTEAQSPHTLTYCLNGGPHSHCSGGRWWKGGHRGQSEEKWVCGEGGDPLIRPTVEIPKLGPPSNMFTEDYYYYASSTKKLWTNY